MIYLIIGVAILAVAVGIVLMSTSDDDEGIFTSIDKYEYIDSDDDDDEYSDYVHNPMTTMMPTIIAAVL